ncbi:uncharacterized protein LOC127802703 isoform X2 [Diospyros lotus]|uniref:uncharacterized protein LOC127802703 isoform X2 n=1 Tax=Diospyros lotus TaxID=55363 RepID=UPI002254B19A|nr:uncharacterized protein LOC127802703 isoform X2 [Diospyros lotus]
MKPMQTLQDLIEEAKLRTVYWALCVFAVAYFLTNTSKSMWMNIPISVLFVSALRIIFNEVEFKWKVRKICQQTYLMHLENKQLSVNDSCLLTMPPPPKWKRKIDSPIVEAAMEEFIDKVLRDFVTDLWYSDITPDKEGPELMHGIIMDVLGEVSQRVKEINLVDLLTRDIVDLVGDHLELFRRNQAVIGVDVMGTLSSEERDDHLKHHLIASKELHPALISSECEYKVLQRLIGGLLAVVLRPQEAQCPVVCCIARELVTSLVVQPLMNFASPGYVNELIEYIFLAIQDNSSKDTVDDQSTIVGHTNSHAVAADIIQGGSDPMVLRSVNQKEISLDASENLISQLSSEDPMHPHAADWARILDAATQRRTEVLMPENLENMWTRGRNYKKKIRKTPNGEFHTPISNGSLTSNAQPTKILGKEMLAQRSVISSATDEKARLHLLQEFHTVAQVSGGKNNVMHLSDDLNKDHSVGGAPLDELEDTASHFSIENKRRLKRSNSTSALNIQLIMEKSYTNEGGRPIISDFYYPDFSSLNNENAVKGASDVMFGGEGIHRPKLRSRVIGAYFEKLGSKSFAVYSIAVTDADKRTWFVKRRYRNFERLHRHLKDIPNYTLHLPPKRIFSSSTEDAFVHQRCIQLDKYLQDLLSIPNVAEQHEVWDFLSVSSKNYSFGKSSSVMSTLVVNVDDAFDDIVRQFKGVSDGLMRKVIGSSSLPHEASPVIPVRNLSLNSCRTSKHLSWQSSTASAKSISDEEDHKDDIQGHEEVEPTVHANGWHSDNELNSKGFPPRVVKRGHKSRNLESDKKHGMEAESLSGGLGRYPAAGFPVTSDNLEDPVQVPPEFLLFLWEPLLGIVGDPEQPPRLKWIPPNLTLPVLNLVDKMFQLKRRGWLRRQVFWISKQILQLMMEDAIDDWLLRQIQWLRRDDVIAQGIRWVQDVLWPDGTFYRRLNTPTQMDDCQCNQRSFQSTSSCSAVSNPGSFELQLEAARRASDVKKMIFNGAPAALVSLIGHKQYKRCAKDIYYFLQSSICLKQLAYGILELILVSIFPELRDLMLDIHEKMRSQPE